MIYLAVALGGALGALSRFGIGQWLADSGYAHLHPATFLVNVIGALLIGILFIGAERFTLSEPARLGISVGFLGAFTTFSAFSLDTVTLLQNAAYLKASLNIGLNLFASIGATFIGFLLVRNLAPMA